MIVERKIKFIPFSLGAARLPAWQVGRFPILPSSRGCGCSGGSGGANLAFLCIFMKLLGHHSAAQILLRLPPCTG